MTATKNTAGGPSTPSGTAGGDLAGSYPNPSVAKVGGKGVPQIFGQSGAPSSVTGTTVETVLATVNIPANALSVNGRLRVKMLTDQTNNANVKTIKVKFGGQSAVAYASLASSASYARDVNIFNRGVANSQVCEAAASGSGIGAQSVGSTTLTVDTTQAQTVQITGQLGTSTDTLTLSAYAVEVWNP